MNEKKPQKQKMVPLTEEQKLATLVAAKALAEDQKLRAEKIATYDRRVRKMSFHQLHGELRREARRPTDNCLLTSAWAAVLLTVLTNTQTKENPFAKLAAYPR